MEIMNVKMKLHEKPLSHLLSLSQYQPSDERMVDLVREYQQDTSIQAYACKSSGMFIGLIVIKETAEHECEILSIATLEGHRNKGVGKHLVRFLSQIKAFSPIIAETDKEAVGFYAKCGFKIVCLGEKYPEATRYSCSFV